MHGTVMMINMTIYDNYPLELGHSLFSKISWSHCPRDGECGEADAINPPFGDGFYHPPMVLYWIYLGRFMLGFMRQA